MRTWTIRIVTAATLAAWLAAPAMAKRDHDDDNDQHYGRNGPTSVPEPASLALLGGGLAALAGLAWHRGRRKD